MTNILKYFDLLTVLIFLFKRIKKFCLFLKFKYKRLNN